MAEALKRWDANSNQWVTVASVNRIEVQGGDGIWYLKTFKENDGSVVNIIAVVATPIPI